jgi:hypothetical protein
VLSGFHKQVRQALLLGGAARWMAIGVIPPREPSEYTPQRSW